MSLEEKDLERQNPETDRELLAVLEAVLFASGEEVSFKRLAEVLSVGMRKLKSLLRDLKERHREGGLEILQGEGGVRMATRKKYSPYIDILFSNPKRRGLSDAALEVLAIIALRQPVTKAQIEEMRGVSSDSALRQLIRRELIYCSGTSDRIGSPMRYSTTPKFLEVFNLKTLEELPSIDDIHIG